MTFKESIVFRGVLTPFRPEWIDNKVLFLLYDFIKDRLSIDAHVITFAEMSKTGPAGKTPVEDRILNYGTMDCFETWENVEIFTDRESVDEQIRKFNTGQNRCKNDLGIAAMGFLLSAFRDELPSRTEIEYSIG